MISRGRKIHTLFLLCLLLSARTSESAAGATSHPELRCVLFTVVIGGAGFTLYELGHLFTEDSTRGGAEGAEPVKYNDASILSCLFMQCPNRGQPSARRVALLESSPFSFRQGVTNGDLTSQDINARTLASVPLPIITLLSPKILAQCDAHTLASVIKEHSGNTVVAEKIISALEGEPDDKRLGVIKELLRLSLPVEQVVGEAASRWWGSNVRSHQDLLPLKDLAQAGSPLLVLLSPGFLADLPDAVVTDILHILQNRPSADTFDRTWAKKFPFSTKRVWMELYKRNIQKDSKKLHINNADKLAMLLSGATSDEIKSLSVDDKLKSNLLSMKLTKLQVRAMMDILYKDGQLETDDMIELADWLPKMSPAELHRFPVFSSPFSNIRDNPRFVEQASFATTKQLVECLVAKEILFENFASDCPGTWGDELAYLKQLVHLIPPSQLTNYSSHPLSRHTLTSVDSYYIMQKQARILTLNGSLIELNSIDPTSTLHGLLAAVSTRALMMDYSAMAAEFSKKLVQWLPQSNPARSAVVLSRIRNDLHSKKNVEALLRNRARGQFFRMLFARDIFALREALENSLVQDEFNVNPSDDPTQFIKLLPDNTLSALMTFFRRELPGSKPWTMESLLNVSRPLLRESISGLSCADVMAMELEDLPLLISAFNVRRSEVGLPFPKRLQYCTLKALSEYLKMKSDILGLEHKSALIANLEPSEIRAFGGYVLGSLPLDIIRLSKHAEMILSQIGSLPLEHLVAAIPDLNRLEYKAMEMVSVMKGNRNVTSSILFKMGSLSVFLPEHIVNSIHPYSWRLFVEAQSDLPSLSVCGTKNQRESWRRLLVSSFGEPASWSPGVVGTLGDLLAVLEYEDLNGIRASIWRDAADTLAERTMFSRPVEVVGRDVASPFVDVCRSLLPEKERAQYMQSVRFLHRQYLQASQHLLNTVKEAKALVHEIPAVKRLEYSRLQTSIRNSISSSEAPSLSTVVTSSETYPDKSTSYPDTQTKRTETTFAHTETTTKMFPTFNVGDNDEDFEKMMDSKPDWLKAALEKAEGAQPTTPYTPATVIYESPDQSLDVETTSETHEKTTTVPTLPGLTDQEYVEEMDNVSMSAVNIENKTAAASSQGVAILEHDPPDPVVNFIGRKNRSNAIRLSRATQDYVTGHRQKREYPWVSSWTEDLYPEKSKRMEITCESLRALGGSAWLALMEDDHIKDVELEDCLEVLGRMPLPPPIAASLWKVIPERNLDDLGDMGSLVSAITKDDVAKLNLSLTFDRALDSLSVIAEHVVDEEVLQAVAERFTAQNPGLEKFVGLETVKKATLTALGHTVCYLSIGVQRILLSHRHAIQYISSSMNINAHSLPCNVTCFEELIRQASSGDALGDVSKWNAEDLTDLGIIAAGLSSEQLLSLVRNESSLEHPLAGLTAAAARCLSQQQVESIGNAMGVISPVAAQAIAEERRSLLSIDQKQAWSQTIRMFLPIRLGKVEGSIGSSDKSAGISVKPMLIAVLCSFWFLLRII